MGIFAWCSPCHSGACGGQGNPFSCDARDRPLPFTSDRHPNGSGCVQAGRGDEPRAPWTPRVATSTGARGGYVPSLSPAHSHLNLPAPTLLIESSPGTGRPCPSAIYSARDNSDFNITPNPRASLDASPTRDPNAKAAERARLKRIVSEFSQEAAAGRRCTLVWLVDGESSAESSRVQRGCRYQLQEELSKLVLQCQPSVEEGSPGNDNWEVLGTWPMHTVLGAHRADESALVQKHEQTVVKLISHEELGRAAVLEFGGACASRVPVLLVEESADYRDKFVNGMRILRLYRGAAQQRLESARGPEDKLSWPLAQTKAAAPEPSPVKTMVAVPCAKPGERSSPGGSSGSPRLNNGGHSPRE